MSIRRKITLLSSSWLLCILVIVDLLVYLLFIRIVTHNETEALNIRAQEVIAEFGPSLLMVPNLESGLEQFLPGHSTIRIVDKRGIPITVVYNDIELIRVKSKFVESFSSELNKEDGSRILIVRYPFGLDQEKIGTVEIAQKMESLQWNLQILVFILILSTGAAVLLAFLGGRLISNMILNPIAHLIDTMEQVEKSLEFKKIEIPNHKPNDELYKMANTFNRMIDRIEQNVVHQKRFVSDASHELKTTLTIIEGYASMLRRWGMNDESVRNEAIESIYLESIRMKKMTAQMLSLAINDRGIPISLESFNLVELCKKAARLFRIVHRREIEIMTEEESIPLEADKMKIKQLILIILDNALKYSKNTIFITLAKDEQWKTIRIRDRGIGIPKNEIGQVFERFYRVDKARARKTGGSGLGLSIAKSIVDEHRGQIEVQSEEGKGTEIIIRLP